MHRPKSYYDSIKYKIIKNNPYNLINLRCLFHKRPKLYDDFSCTLKTTKATLHSNLTALCIVSYVTSQQRHRSLPSTFPRSFDVAMFIIRHSSKRGVAKKQRYNMVCSSQSKKPLLTKLNYLHLPKPTVARFSVSKNEEWGFLETDGLLSADVSTDFG